MAGGTWTSQNKVRPGVYIRFKSGNPNGLTVGERGVVTIARPMSWGPVGQVVEIEAGSNMVPITGYDITSENNRFLNEIFKGSNRTAAPRKVLLYRLTGTGAVQASATIGTVTVTAKYPGIRGNDISVVITEETDDTFTVSTVVDNEVVNQQNGITAISDLQANDWVTFGGTGSITATTGTALTGGLDGTAGTAAYTSYLEAIDPYKFDVMIYDGSDSTVMDAMVAFIKRIADESGAYAQLVASGFTSNPDTLGSTTLSVAQCCFSAPVTVPVPICGPLPVSALGGVASVVASTARIVAFLQAPCKTLGRSSLILCILVRYARISLEAISLDPLFLQEDNLLMGEAGNDCSKWLIVTVGRSRKGPNNFLCISQPSAPSNDELITRVDVHGKTKSQSVGLFYVRGRRCHCGASIV